MKQILSISNIVLAVIALVMTLAGAYIVNACGGDKLSSVLTGAAAGIVGTMLFGAIADKCNWSIASSPVAGVVGMAAGVILSYLFI